MSFPQARVFSSGNDVIVSLHNSKVSGAAWQCYALLQLQWSSAGTIYEGQYIVPHLVQMKFSRHQKNVIEDQTMLSKVENHAQNSFLQTVCPKSHVVFGDLQKSRKLVRNHSRNDFHLISFFRANTERNGFRKRILRVIFALAQCCPAFYLPILTSCYFHQDQLLDYILTLIYIVPAGNILERVTILVWFGWF